MSAEKKKQRGALGLIVALVAVLLGGVLFVGAVSGWFDNSKVTLEQEYYGYIENEGLADLSVAEYEELVNEKKSFVVLVDQSGCKTADRLKEYMDRYMNETGVFVFKIMFSDAKESSLHDFVKYYPSVVIVDNGRVKWFLRADNDEDAEEYNDYDEFKKWMDNYLVIKK